MNDLGDVSVSDAGELGRQDNKVDWKMKQIIKKVWRERKRRGILARQ